MFAKVKSFVCQLLLNIIYSGSYMSAHVLMNLLNLLQDGCQNDGCYDTLPFWTSLRCISQQISSMIVLLNQFHKLGKRNEMLGLPRVFSLFHNLLN